jgi:diphthamide synthase subunit DPH2
VEENYGTVRHYRYLPTCCNVGACCVCDIANSKNDLVVLLKSQPVAKANCERHVAYVEFLAIPAVINA